MTVQDPKPRTSRAEVRVARSRAELEALRADWDRLAALDPRDGIFRGYAWNALWLEHVAPEATPHVACVVRDGETIGLASLCETGFRHGPFRMPAFGFTGREVVSGDFLDILSAPGAEDVVLDSLFAHFDTTLRSRSLLILGELLEDGRTTRHALAWAERRGIRVRRQEERRCPYIELPATFEEYRQGLSRKTRKNMGRNTRQLLGPQGCEMVRRRGPEEVLPCLPDFYRLHAARWESVGQAGNFVRPGFCAFLEKFVTNAHPLVRSEIYALEQEGTPIATLLFFRWGKTVIFFQGGWDPTSPLTRFSPNLVILGRAIEDAIEDGCETFEFLRGEESYKQKIAASARETATYLFAGRGLRPRAYFAAMGVKDWIKARLGRA